MLNKQRMHNLNVKFAFLNSVVIFSNAKKVKCIKHHFCSKKTHTKHTTGHLLCADCHPKFVNCPTCKVLLTENIRNRALEQLLERLRPSFNCAFHKYGCSVLMSDIKLRKHHFICKYRPIKCPFNGCAWYESYHELCKHLEDSHHTCSGSMQRKVSTGANNNVYQFSHAIKFPNFDIQNANV